ncbi:hypothetical protein J3A83DRAFT_4187790 [Scleroderma citrinum]
MYLISIPNSNHVRKWGLRWLGSLSVQDLYQLGWSTFRRAKEAGMVDLPLVDVVRILICEKYSRCGSPPTVSRICGLQYGFKFVDACIVGYPPKDGCNLTFYASADIKDDRLLDEFTSLPEHGELASVGLGVKDVTLVEADNGGSHQGYCWGICHFDPGSIWMALVAHEASPEIAEALMNERNISQPMPLDLLIRIHTGGEVEREACKTVPAYRKPREGDQANVDILKEFAKNARELQG